MTFHIAHSFRHRHRIMPPLKRILIAKTTQLGDLVISLPMASALKRQDDSCEVILLTNPRTVDVARCCADVDEVYGEPQTRQELLALLISLKVDTFIQVSPSRTLAQLAQVAGIPNRIGSLFRSYSWRWCTHMVAVSGSFSGLNKRLLDLQYLAPLGIHIHDLDSVRGLYNLQPSSLELDAPLLQPANFSNGRRSIILSPALITAKTHQWPLEFYSRLIHKMDPTQFHWFICGIADDREKLLPLLGRHALDSNVTDMVGRLTLAEFMSFISRCDGLVAGSTGPLHLAAALGIRTLGLFQSRKVDIQRWHPVGPSAAILYSEVKCQGEPRSSSFSRSPHCPCILAIEPERVARHVLAWFEV